MRRFQSLLCWPLYLLSTLLLSVWIAWHLSAQANFGYPIWYSVLNIEQTISESAPRHKFKQRFIETTRQERIRLFEEIVAAVQNNGKGLEQIHYYNQSGEALDSFLTGDEIVHLKDVAHLIHKLNWGALLMVVLGLLLLGLIFLLRLVMPPLKDLVITIVGISLALFILVIIAGPTRIFYWLHTVIFPIDHQWFFYYEESLMSMLMKAPILFAPLGVQLVLLGVLIWLVHLMLLKKTGMFKSV